MKQRKSRSTERKNLLDREVFIATVCRSNLAFCFRSIFRFFSALLVWLRERILLFFKALRRNLKRLFHRLHFRSRRKNVAFGEKKNRSETVYSYDFAFQREIRNQSVSELTHIESAIEREKSRLERGGSVDPTPFDEPFSRNERAGIWRGRHSRGRARV